MPPARIQFYILTGHLWLEAKLKIYSAVNLPPQRWLWAMLQQRSLIAAIILPDSLISPLAASSCNSHTAQLWIHWVNDILGGGGLGESPSHIYSMYWVLQEMRMHYTFSDDKQSYRNVVSHDSLNKLKVLNGEGRILIGFDSISLGFLSLALSFFLRLPISNLSPLPAIAWL